ncbi:hypothetical protein RJ639_005431 [Escallonia herrerae]|uniref:Uncharacterized protein n=1 Tax=Escallonia herrerae TaxID=1293975 RepID=A0AA88VUM6_9ASTE|nr:hypothetical protein RJ639_005431 [Escallonia herrerae]
MASSGGGGAKFVSVNLNKSYGQPSHHSHPSYSGSHGPAPASRVRPGGQVSGGGGMVVLSRQRITQKAALPKLSVPPPLNLPSLRKEHERFDSSGSGGGSTGGAGTGNGSRPTSSGLGWTKPGAAASQEKGDTPAANSVEQSVHPTDSVSRGSSTYMPPSARIGGVGVTVAVSAVKPYQPERAMVLRGEDFPSLHAALPTTSSGPVQKQKDSSNRRQKQIVDEGLSNDRAKNYPLGLPVHMRPHGQSSQPTSGSGLNDNGNGIHRLGGSRMPDQVQKQEDFPAPLPLVRLNPRSDWADDERDTGHGFVDRGRDSGFQKAEAYWDREFDMPRSTIFPHKLPNNQLERWGQRGHEIQNGSSSEILKVDPYRRDVRTPSREGRETNLWRNSPIQKDGFSVQIVHDRNGIGRSPGPYGETGKETKYTPVHRDNAQNGGVAATARRDIGHGQVGRQHWNYMGESFGNRGTEWHTRDRYGADHSNRYRVDAFQKSTVSRSSFSSGGKGLPTNDPWLNFGREKRAFSKSEVPYVEDPFLKDFGSTGYDERDPFSRGLVGVIKKKKDAVKDADFHDPVRESFEAELERVQKLQEMERQRMVEEQERALEQARREEEERLRLIREEEEQRIRLQEEAREAAWRAEQDRLEALRRAEEQKIAREEERRRMDTEEERRKQAAKQKLLELEARMAKREAETVKGGNLVAVVEEKVSGNPMEKVVSRALDLDNWEDSERMVERITTSASSDSSFVNRPFELSSGPHHSRDDSSGFVDRGKPVNPWRRDAFENGNSSFFQPQDPENGHHSPSRDASIGGRAFPRKEFYGGAGYMSSRTHAKGGMQEPNPDDFDHLKEHRWNLTGDDGHFKKNRELESDMYENFAEKYGDVGWGQVRSHGSPHSPYPEQLYPNSDVDDFFSYGRSRYSLRQPRVLPPPSVASMHKASFRGENDRAGPSTSLENDISALQTEYYGGGQEKFETSELYDGQQGSNMNVEQKADKSTTPRCDSQSSLSVSSPPSSPPHLSHDELDESGDSLAIPVTAEGKGIPLSDHESVVLNERSGKDNTVTASSSISAAEDEDWNTENNEEMQEPEEYDEDEDGYQEEDEVHEGDDENIDLTHNFEEMHLEDKDSVHMMDNLVLGFDEGVEVGIPCDDFDGNSKTEESKFGMPEVSVGIVGEEGAVGGICSDGQSLQPMDVQHVIFQPLNAPHTTAASDLLDSADASSQSDQHAFSSSSVGMVSHSSSDQAITYSVSSLPSQGDLPVKLQFGLFSGPSLIPSPVPAIQIGSIQMPLHLHPPVGPSVTHMHPSQPPLFQFGQLRYTSPLSQGILPMTPQSVSFVQPSVQNHYSSNQNSGSSLPIQAGQHTSTHSVKKDNNQSDSLSRKRDVSHESGSSGRSSFSVRHSGENNVLIREGRTEISQSADIKTRSQPGFQAEHKGNQKKVVKDFVPSSDEKGSEGQLRAAPALSRSVSGEKGFNVSGAHGHLSGSKVKKVAYPIRNSGSRSSFPVSEAFRSDSIGYQRRPRRAVQRTEFRIRENGDRRQPSVWVSSSNSGPDDRSNSNGKDVGIITRSGFKRGTMSTKPPQQTIELGSLSSDPISSQEIGSESRAGKGITKGASTRSQGNSGQGNLKRNNTEDDVDAPLQSGIVRIFKQPGIEAPSDEDDFIEVRSKRQMLNDRREQREKEIKAKSRVTKPQRKARYAAQGTVFPTRSNKIYSSVGGEAVKNVRSDYVVSDGRGFVNKEVSSGFSTMSTQPLAPIGTPTTNADADADIRSQTIKSLQTGSVPVVSGGGKDLGPNLIFENKNKVLDSVQTSLSSWSNARINQQVMALTQTQLDEAMKPARFDSHVTSMGGRTTPISDTILPSSSSSSDLVKDKSVSSSASPINSLLAGEKIQFGAVTSPTVLPPSSRVVSHGIGPPGPFRSDIQISHNLSPAENGCTLFFEKDKHSSESCVHLEDCEAEAEAAASAIAVAAISSDEIGGSGLGSVSVSDSKSFGGADVDVVTGVASDLQSGSQSRAEESLSVSLPADLSVETPPISLWPALPSPQNSLSQMLSHFPGGPPSHFPFYEMNPMLGGPIFAFGPQEESGGTQSQSQKSTVSGPGHLGTWQQCHSTLDSFYGHPSGFTGPFISPPGGMPGVQGPPHMVVYNHYTPVGQFGQVGLSFMGATYIPSGKQPDWKHNPTSSAMGIGDGDMNMNMVSGQRNPSNMPAPIQHLAPGSPLLPMASPLAMFDVSPFQSAPDMSAQARWSHIPASPLHSVPLSLPLQQQAEGILPSQFSHGHPVEQSLTANRFPESRTSTPSENGRTFPLVADASATRFPDEFGLVDSSSSIVASVSAQGAVNQSSTGSAIENVGVTRTIRGVSSNNTSSQSSNAFKTQHSQQKNFSNQQYSHSTGYGYQRGGVSQKNSSVGEWSHRRMGFHGRNQSLGAEKIFPPSKVRQIYVAKQTTGGTSTGG